MSVEFRLRTSSGPISLKMIVLSGAPSTGVGQTHSPDTMQSSSTNDASLKRSVFKWVMETNYTI